MFYLIFQHNHRDQDEEQFEFYNGYLYLFWLISYWIVFVFSMFVIPIAQEYEASGDFTFIYKMKRAIWNNIVYYLVLIGIGSIFVLYLVVMNSFTLYNELIKK